MEWKGEVGQGWVWYGIFKGAEVKPYGYVEYEYECLCDDKIYHIGHKALCQLWNLRKMQESVEAAQQTGISRHFQEQEQMTGIERHFEEME